MSEANTILFYTSDKPGAAPFLRVPLTPEGFRYAGYLARYKGILGTDVHAFYAFVRCAERDIGAQSYYVQQGFYGYPRNPGIPVGTERYATLGGDSEWRRYDPSQPSDPEGPRPWVTVPAGAPPPRS